MHALMEETSKLKWGIVGLGKIAHKFASDLLLSDSHIIQSVSSRNITKAKQFKNQYNAFSCYGSYQELFSDPSVDIVYIATPHNSHCDLSIAAMESSKAVLVEKPIGVNAAQTKAMIQKSREQNLFLMEAMWTRFNPVIIDVFDKIKSGLIGEVKKINASFCFDYKGPKENRLLNPNLAGGALLDVGIYPIFLVQSLLGLTDDYSVSYALTDTQVDAYNIINLNYKNAHAAIESSISYDKPVVAEIIGESGKIIIKEPWHKAEGYTLYINDHELDIKITERVQWGYLYEADACRQAMQDGKTESDLWRHEDSLTVISFMDDIRSKMGLKFPFE